VAARRRIGGLSWPVRACRAGGASDNDLSKKLVNNNSWHVCLIYSEKISSLYIYLGLYAYLVQFLFGTLEYIPTVCATPILVLGSVMGQFPLCNGVSLMITIVNSIPLIALHLILDILEFDELIFFPSLNWIFTACVACNDKLTRRQWRQQKNTADELQS
jgi:hypothetical protein